MTFNELQVRTFGVVEDWVTIARSGFSVQFLEDAFFRKIWKVLTTQSMPLAYH